VVGVVYVDGDGDVEVVTTVDWSKPGPGSASLPPQLPIPRQLPIVRRS
jgi:hypothetical protein